ncbi:MAG: TonB-dependent receptor [Ketobacter sp.]|nr:MAG: TonB-dependent receptor [Ketobacter sp.]
MMDGYQRAIITCTFLLPSLAAADYEGDLFSYSLEQLMEVEVTDVLTKADKRDTLSQHIPFSLSILEPNNFYSPLLNSLEQVDHRVSGLVITEYNQVTPQFYIRGVGSNASGSGDDPSVAYMVDGMNLSRPGFHRQQLFDVKQIEVMKGPQGTLYGKGVIGGAVNVVLNKPEAKDYSQLSLGINDRGWDAHLISNRRINEHVNNRVSIAYSSSKGYLENQVTGAELSDTGDFTLREQMAWRAGDHQLEWMLEYGHSSSLEPARMYVGDIPYAAFGGVGLTPYANDWDQVAIPWDGSSAREYYTSSLRYQWDVDYGTWVSHTFFTSGDYEFELPVMPIDFNPSNNAGEEDSWQLSQELRLQVEWREWSWNAGLFLSREGIKRDELADFVGLVSLLGAAPLLTPDTPGTTFYDSTNDVLNAALFAQGRWHFAADWRASLGLRRDYVKKDFRLSVTGGDPLDIGLLNSADFLIDTSESWQEWSYSLSLDYHMTEQLMWYALVSSGFKAGNFNSLATSPQSALASSRPESAVNTELGWKGFFRERALQFNGAVFHMDYEDLQVFAGVESEANAPQADIAGMELEVRFRLRQGLELSGNYTYLDTEFEHFLSPGSGEDLAGNRLLRAPSHALVLRLNYSWQDQRQTRYWVEWDGSYTSQLYSDPQNARGSRIPGYTVSDAALYLQPAGAQGVMALWVRNLFDEHYPLHAFGQEVFLYTPRGSAWNLAAPRTLGLSFSWDL